MITLMYSRHLTKLDVLAMNRTLPEILETYSIAMVKQLFENIILDGGIPEHGVSLDIKLTCPKKVDD